MFRYDRAFLDRLSERLGDYLLMTGRSLKKNFNCASPEHEDKHPSMHFYGTTCFCFSCGARYDIFKMVGADFSILDFPGQVEKVCELFNVSTKDAEAMTQAIRLKEQKRAEEPLKKRNFAKLFAYCRFHINETDYPSRRGLSENIVKKAGLGFHPKFLVNKDGETWPMLIIPVDSNHFVGRNTDPHADKRSRFHVSSGGRVLYTKFSDLKNSKNPTWIVEGEIDALSIADVGGEVIALGSTQNISKLLGYLKENPPQAPLILSLDADKTGRKAQEELSVALRDAGIHFIPAKRTGFKDVNALLLSDSDKFRQYVHRETLSAVFSNGFNR